MTVAIAGAIALELKGIRRLGRFRGSSAGGTDYEAGGIHGVDVALFVSGVGEDAAYRTAKAACEALPLAAYVSIGLSGALDPGLRRGDIVIGTSAASLDSPGAVYPCDGGLLESAKAALPGKAIISGPLVASGRVFVTAEEKRKYFGGEGSKPLAVDMETFGAARACSEAGVPFLAVRAISDTLDEDLPVDFNRFMEGGQMRWPAFLIHVLARPRAVPPLMRLGRHSKAAADNLARFIGEFLLKCREQGRV